jgi:hypothetical protein
MSLELLFEELRGQQPPAPFAPAALVRRRGRQRAHRQALTASAAVLAVAGAGVGTLASVAGPPDPPVMSPPPSSESASTSPSAPASSFAKVEPTIVPSDALLGRADLGPGEWEKLDGEIFEGSDIWFWADACPAYVAGRYESLVHRPRLATVHWAKPGTSVTEIIDSFEAGWGPRNLADVRAVLDLCASAPPPTDRAPTRYEVVATDFAGDESLLVKISQYYYDGETIAPAPFVTYMSVIRIGDTVVTVHSSGSEEYARSLAERSVAKLR